MLKAAVVGATGYTGEELVRILAYHPRIKLTYVSGKEERSKNIQEIFPYLGGVLDLPCPAFRPEEALKRADLFFLSLPHTVSMKVAPLLIREGKRVVDISADYRLKDPDIYEKFYEKKHEDLGNLTKAVYGLPELFRDRIREAQLVANPGCYPTSALLAVLPLLNKETEWVGPCIIDAKSGVTGAGRKANASLLFSQVNENFKAYKVLSHQHIPEIRQIINFDQPKGRELIFVPHLIPIDRGILSTVYIRCQKKSTVEEISDLFHGYYARDPFVRVLPIGRYPELKDVLRTNQCHIGLASDPKSGTLIVLSAIDNLGKGAAGQAVQNMNLMFGFEEREGLK